jgi:hypothetical protein
MPMGWMMFWQEWMHTGARKRWGAKLKKRVLARRWRLRRARRQTSFLGPTAGRQGRFFAAPRCQSRIWLEGVQEGAPLFCSSIPGKARKKTGLLLARES